MVTFSDVIPRVIYPVGNPFDSNGIGGFLSFLGSESENHTELV